MKPDHDIATNTFTKIPAIVALFSPHREAISWLARLQTPGRVWTSTERSRRTCSRSLGAVRTKPVCTGQEAGQHDEANRRQAGTSRAPRSSSAPSTPTRRRARSRRRRRSRSSTANGRPLIEELAATCSVCSACRTANGAGLHQRHGQPHVNKGGAGGPLRRRTRRRTPRQRRTLTCGTAPAVAYSDYRAEEAKRNPGQHGFLGFQGSGLFFLLRTVGRSSWPVHS